MFGKFKKAPAPPSPLKDDRRQWVETSFHLLVDTFGKEAMLQRRVLRPHHSDFPIRYNGEPQAAQHTLEIVARQMEIDPAEIDLSFYQDTTRIISAGTPFGGSLSAGIEEGEKSSDEIYFGKSEDGKYHLSFDKEKQQRPEGLVAILAHELARIKLLDTTAGNDRHLADLTTVIFGLGIFNANAAFFTFSNGRSLSWSQSGYLTQMEWGYSLALFAGLRNEKTPAWIEYLGKNVKADFGKSEQYIAWQNQTQNPD